MVNISFLYGYHFYRRDGQYFHFDMGKIFTQDVIYNSRPKTQTTFGRKRDPPNMHVKNVLFNNKQTSVVLTCGNMHEHNHTYSYHHNHCYLPYLLCVVRCLIMAYLG